MLQTSKHAVEAEIYNSRLKIMNRDLENIQRYLEGVSTESALLVGFTFVSFQLNDPTYLDAVDTPNQPATNQVFSFTRIPQTTSATVWKPQ